MWEGLLGTTPGWGLVPCLPAAHEEEFMENSERIWAYTICSKTSWFLGVLFRVLGGFSVGEVPPVHGVAGVGAWLGVLVVISR